MTTPRIVQVHNGNFDSFLEKEALMSLTKAILMTDEMNEAERTNFNNLIQRSEREQRDTLSIAIEEAQTFSTRTTADCLLGYARYYDTYISSAIDILGATMFFYDLDRLWKKDNSLYVHLVKEVLNGLETLTIFSLQSVKSDNHYIGLASTFQKIASECERLGSDELCLNNLLTGINFARKKELRLCKKMMEQALRLSQKKGEKDIRTLLLQRAMLHCEIAEESPTQRISAFDATAQLIRYILIKKQVEGIEPSEEMTEQIKFLLKDYPYLVNLGIIYFSATGLLDRPKEIPDIAAAYTCIWTRSFPEWGLDFYKRSGNIIFEIEDERLKLFKDSTDKSIQTRFNDWTIQHHNLLQAIPHSRSILKEKYLSDILMELKHELIHVHSLFGSIGATLSVMRWGLVEIELTLFLHQNNNGISEEHLKFASDRLFSSTEPVQLTKADLESLLHVDRSVELEQKIKIIENIWTPWFEGIAVFGEMADDPILDAEIESLPSTVIKHLADLIISSDDLKEKKREEFLKEHLKEMEWAYHESIQKRAPDRLRNYLTRHHKKYLPGYLCVRKLLSKWRNTYHDKTIRGDQAARLLLHLTRFSGFEMIPDISLEMSRFRTECMKKHLEWQASLTSLSYKDIDSFLTQDQTSVYDAYAWEYGKLRKPESDPQTMETNAIEQILEKGRECLKYIINDDLLEKRIAHSDKEIKKRLKDAINVIQLSPSFLVNEKFSFLLSGRYIVLPLAQAQCYFWLIEDGNRVNIVIRTREKDKDAGIPRYNIVSLPLPKEKYDSLKEIVCLTGIPYLDVTRAVVLGGTEKPQLSGTHYFVYQCGDWIYTASGGIFFGSDPSQDVINLLQNRFTPNNFIEYKEAINKEKHPLARRTMHWIMNNNWRFLSDHSQVADLASWAEEVQLKCEEVISSKTDDIDNISLLLYDFVLNDKQLAKQFCSDGIGALRDSDDFRLTDKFIDFLMRSSLEPTKKEEDATLARTINQLFPNLLEDTGKGWDFTK